VANIAQYGGDGQGAGIDHRVNPQGRQQGFIGSLVDQGDGARTASVLGENRREDIGLIVIGYGDHRIGGPDAGLVEQHPVEGVALQDNDIVTQLARNQIGAFCIPLDNFEIETPGRSKQFLGEMQTHVAAPDNDDPAPLLLVMAEGRHHRAHPVRARQNIYVVPDRDPVIRFGDEAMALTQDRQDGRLRQPAVGGYLG